MVLIEDVVGVVVIVEEGERDGRLAVGKHVDIVGVDSVVTQKFDDIRAHAVVAGLADESGFYAAASQGYGGVEGGTAGNRADGLSVLEDNVEYGLANSYYFSHDFKTVHVFGLCCRHGCDRVPDSKGLVASLCKDTVNW